MVTLDSYNSHRCGQTSPKISTASANCWRVLSRLTVSPSWPIRATCTPLRRTWLLTAKITRQRPTFPHCAPWQVEPRRDHPPGLPRKAARGLYKLGCCGRQGRRDPGLPQDTPVCRRAGPVPPRRQRLPGVHLPGRTHRHDGMLRLVLPEAARSLALKGARSLPILPTWCCPNCQRSMVTRSLENAVFTMTTNRYGSETLATRA